MDPLDRQIADSVNVDPSPDFVARVRARVASEHISVRPRLWPVVAGACLAATLGVAIYVQRLDRSRPVVGTATVAVVRVPPTVALVEQQSAPVVQHRARVVRHEPEVIVASEELRAWRQLADLMRSGQVELRFDDHDKPTIAESSTVQEIAVKPIAIAPLTVASISEQGDEQ